MLARVTLVVGKGGVGKTTCAVGIAASLAKGGESTLLVSTDPAGSLGTVLGATLTRGAVTLVDGVKGLSALQLDVEGARKIFLGRWREVLVAIVDRGTYLDVEDIGGLIDAALPGADEIFGLLVLADWITQSAGNENRFTRFVIDTAPTGHTLRLLALPETFEAMIALLETMQSKHRFIVQALTHRYRRDAADEFLDEMRRTVGGLRTTLRDAAETRAVLITRAEPVVVSETTRYAEALRDLGLAIAAVIVEALPAIRSGENEAAVSELAKTAPEGGFFLIPQLSPPAIGVMAITESLGAGVVAEAQSSDAKAVPRADAGLARGRAPSVTSKAGGAPADAVDRDEGIAAPLELLRTLTIVGGKGGVGKTTVSCALALSAALDEEKGNVLLVSTDPAPSLADALAVTTPRWAHDAPQQLDKVPRLDVWQMDASAAFQQMRERYRDRIDTLFEGLTGRNIDVAHDRTVLRDLLALAPPGIDEMYALASLGHAIEQQGYAQIVIDPAPTGHLLRLLELPALAIDWSHRLMRLMMKYKEIIGLGDVGQDLVNFSRRTRQLETLLHDPLRAGVVLVSLDEPVVIAETTRLADILEATRIPVLGEVRNRVISARTSAHAHRAERNGGPAVVYEAPNESAPPVGAETIRAWSRRWTRRG
jgi:arsenite-transporting ATPase